LFRNDILIYNNADSAKSRLDGIYVCHLCVWSKND